MTAEPFRDVAEAYRRLAAALRAIEDEGDRLVARDALRDALDRDRRELAAAGTGIVADTFTVEDTIHHGEAFLVLGLRHRDLGTRHALKTLVLERRDEPLLRDLLREEGRNHLRVPAHPAVLSARALLRLPDGRPGLLLDRVEGGTLADRLAQAPLPEALALRLARRVLGALEAVHEAGLLHLDLAPSNVLLRSGGVADALLADFGLSLPIGRHHGSKALSAAATQGFAAPEQVGGGRPLGPETDLFALGRLVLAAMGGEAAPACGLRTWAGRLSAPERSDRPPDAAAALRLLGP